MSDNKPCRNCGKNVKAERSTKEFCSTECHDDWWGQSRKLGAQMMDAFPCLCSDCKAKVTKIVNSAEKRQQTSAKASDIPMDL